MGRPKKNYTPEEIEAKKEYARQKAKEWYHKHKDDPEYKAKQAERCRANYIKNKPTIQAKQKEWYEKNKNTEEYQAKKKKWYLENKDTEKFKEQQRAANARSRAKKKAKKEKEKELLEPAKQINAVDYIKAVRQQTGLSQARFAELYGIPQRSLESWEDGHRVPPPYVLSLLKRAVKEDFPKKEENKHEENYQQQSL